MIAQRAIGMIVNDVHGFFHHRFILRSIRPGGTEGGAVMRAEQFTEFGKHRFIPAGARYSHPEVIAQDGG